MSGIESTGEDPRIILVDSSGNAIEVTPTNETGSFDRLFVVRASLEAGIKSGLLGTNPFIVSKSERTPPASDHADAGLASTRIAILRREDLPTRRYPGISKDKEWDIQSRRLAGIYARRLGLSDEEYIAKLPDFPENPPDYEDPTKWIPFIAEGNRIPWMEQAQLSDIYVSDYLRNRADEAKEWEEDPEKFKTPEVPYSFWAQNGTLFVGKSPEFIRGVITKDSVVKIVRGGVMNDGITYWDLRPDIVVRRFFDLIYFQVGSGYCAFRCRWRDQAGLFADHVDDADPGYASLVCGRDFVTKPLVA